MTKYNCWEIMNCGRGCNGGKINEFGICPAAISIRANGINGGNCGGRACWAIVGTMCGGKVQGTFAEKFKNCRECEFFKMVLREEGEEMVGVKEVVQKLSPEMPQ